MKQIFFDGLCFNLYKIRRNPRSLDFVGVRNRDQFSIDNLEREGHMFLRFAIGRSKQNGKNQ